MAAPEQSTATESANVAATAAMPAAPDTAVSITGDRAALGSVAAHVRFWLIAVAGLSFDLWSKHWAFQTLHQGPGSNRVIIPGVLEFQTMFNTGALFGIGQGQTTLFIIASFLALALVLWMFARSPAQRWLLQIALGAVLAGAVGNMYDRLTVRLYEYRPHQNGPPVFLAELPGPPDMIRLREYPPNHPDSAEFMIPIEHRAELGDAVGCVRDFIKIPTRLWNEVDLWPWVFNVADMLLVGGVGILAVFLFFDPAREDAPTPEKRQSA